MFPKNSLGADGTFMYSESYLQHSLATDFNRAVAEILSYGSTATMVSDDFLVKGAVNKENGVDETIVIDIKAEQIKEKVMYVTADARDTVIFRWDANQACATNGACSGRVEIKDGSAIVPLGGLTVDRIFHLADFIHAGGSRNPVPAELMPLGLDKPTRPDGTGLFPVASPLGEDITLAIGS